MPSRPPAPPFDLETATLKVRLAEDAWNSRDPARVALAYTPDSVWRNRDLFLTGREAIVDFLTGKWRAELDYPADQRALGVRGGPHRGAVPVRVP